MPGISTVVLHADRDVHPTRAVAPPIYTRYGNPNHALVSAGDHVIGQKSTYRGTASVLLNLLPRLGVSTSLVDRADPEAFEKALTPQTRLVLVEAPSNPLLQITDLRAVAELARAHDVLGALSRPGDPPAARAGSQS